MRIAALLSLALLAGCVSTMLEKQIGKPVQAFVAEKGPPSTYFDMPDGRRAFQWASQSRVQLPAQAWTTQAGNSALTTVSGGQSITSTCRMTLYTRWRPQSEAWIVESYEYHGC